MSSSSTGKGRLKGGQIPGTKPSVHNNVLLVSTGVPSLDTFLGGGLAVGSLLLIDEDKFRTYSSLILRYFIGEGIVGNQITYVGTADRSPDDVLKDLPACIDYDPAHADEKRPTVTSKDGLEIAWRYKNVPNAEVSSSTFGHYYDITKSMDKSTVDAARVIRFDSAHTQAGDRDKKQNSLDRLLSSIKLQIQEHELRPTSSHRPRDILRIAISGLGSPYWKVTESEVSYFLLKLRALLRSSYTTCLVTVPGHLYQNISPFVKLSDAALQFISFADHAGEYRTNPAFKEYHGLMKIHKLPRINSLTCQMPDTMDWVFKLKRKYFTIQRMHLPPDLSETVSRSQEDALSCRPGPGKPSNLEF